MNLFVGMVLGVMLNALIRFLMDKYFDREVLDHKCPPPPDANESYAGLVYVPNFWAPMPATRSNYPMVHFKCPGSDASETNELASVEDIDAVIELIGEKGDIWASGL